MPFVCQVVLRSRLRTRGPGLRLASHRLAPGFALPVARLAPPPYRRSQRRPPTTRPPSRPLGFHSLATEAGMKTRALSACLAGFTTILLSAVGGYAVRARQTTDSLEFEALHASILPDKPQLFAKIRHASFLRPSKYEPPTALATAKTPRQRPHRDFVQPEF